MASRRPYLGEDDNPHSPRNVDPVAPKGPTDGVPRAPRIVRPGEAKPGEDVRRTRTTPVPLVGLPAHAREHGGDLGWKTFRPKQGPSGTWHWGLDLPTASLRPSGNATPVVAPERLKVVHVWTNNTTPPFVGYGPAGVLGLGDSGVYHLLAHLDPTAWSSGAVPKRAEVYEPGEYIGLVDPKQAHVHWEVRIEPIDSPDTRAGNTIDPIRWVRGESRVLRDDPPSSGGGVIWLLGLLLLAGGKRRGKRRKP
jgi:hypothetical protein